MNKLPNGAMGKELILDIHDCSEETLTKESLDNFFIEMCKEIDMQRTELFYWEYSQDANKSEEEFNHLKGWSAVQFILTSNITAHSFEVDRKMSLNIFSCKDFNESDAEKFCIDYFKGKLKNSTCILRY
ncbi:MAG TPA: hypothetical protein DEG71_03625 [Clostridiales bacterium]|nr:hypothetical protein [Clostridiales bacterium]